MSKNLDLHFIIKLYLSIFLFVSIAKGRTTIKKFEANQNRTENAKGFPSMKFNNSKIYKRDFEFQGSIGSERQQTPDIPTPSGTTEMTTDGTSMGFSSGTTEMTPEETNMGSSSETTSMGFSEMTTDETSMGSSSETTAMTTERTNTDSSSGITEMITEGTSMGSSSETTVMTTEGTSMGSSPGTTVMPTEGTNMGSSPGTTVMTTDETNTDSSSGITEMTTEGTEMPTTTEESIIISTTEAVEITSTSGATLMTSTLATPIAIDAMNAEGSCQDICGRAASKRIVGGAPTSIQNHPWMVQIVNKRTSFNFCGGTIISRTVILTAAHCVIRKKAGRIAVRIGHTSNRQPGTLVNVKKIKAHKKYSSKRNQANDIAILYLETPLEFTAEVRPICLTSEGVFNGKRGVISGWGRTSEGGQRSPTLEEATVEILEYETCRELSDYGRKQLNKKVLCAREDNTDTCQGDSGGPLAVFDGYKYVQVGITSYGRGCARPGFPGIYTKVTHFSDWINKKLKNDECFRPEETTTSPETPEATTPSTEEPEGPTVFPAITEEPGDIAITEEVMTTLPTSGATEMTTTEAMNIVGACKYSK